MKAHLHNFDKAFPIISLIAIFAYFLFDGFFTGFMGKTILLVLCLGFAASDAIFRFLAYGFSKREAPRFLASGLGLGAILSYLIRGWLDFPPQPGVSQETTMIPKVREFLLALTVVFAIAFLAYTILLEMGRRSLEAQSQLSDKKKGLLQNTVIGFLFLLPILVAINYIAIMRNYNFDLTGSGKYSLSPISRNLLGGLSKNVEIIAFYPRPLEADGPKSSVGSSLALSRIRPDLEIMVDQYKSASPKILTRFINADVETDLLSGMGQVSNGMVLVRSPREMLPGETNAYNEERVVVREKSDLEDLERKMTSAILNVTTPKRKVYFTSANGERYGVAFRNMKNEQIGTFTGSLNYLNFQLNELGFSQGWPKEIPEDADLLAIIGPTVPMNETARKAILDYVIQKKGKVFITAEPKGKEDFSWLLDRAGVKLISEPLYMENTRPNLIVAKKFPEHPISDLLPKKDLGIVYPHAGYLETFVDGKNPFDFTSKFVLESGMGAFVDPLGTAKMQSKEDSKNFPLAVVLRTLNDSDSDIKNQGRVVFYSGTSWMTDQFIPYNMNKNLALSSVSWLYQNSIINEIPKKKDEVDVVNLNDNQKIMVWLIGMFLFPGAIVFAGSYYVISRRKRGQEEL